MENRINREARRKLRVRAKIKKEGYKLTLSRSARYLFAQIIDQKSGKTVLGLTDKKLLNEEESKKAKQEKAKIFGTKFAKEVSDRKIKEAFFDRGQYRYHGRVRAFVEGLREGGLKF